MYPLTFSGYTEVDFALGSEGSDSPTVTEKPTIDFEIDQYSVDLMEDLHQQGI